ncbi:MAG: TlyA family RNA methyltransferase [Parvibaculaceae bacterium]|nr:TlyA family RNA methyltransferase [Parvibaculaceae bacterium]
MRLDLLLVAQGLAPTRARAQSLIKGGKVRLNGKTLTKASSSLSEDVVLEVIGDDNPWVSRAALKLVQGLDAFDLTVSDLTCLDVGASTGGFSQVMLARGARKVYSVDVGHGQLANVLREDARVVNLEGLNAKDLSSEHIAEPIDLIVSDVSFISLEKALPQALALCGPNAHLCVLVKPQFEVGKGRVGKGGIVKDPALHEEVCTRLSDWLAGQPGWQVIGLTDSPITGSDGNKEFLLVGRKQEVPNG